MIIIMIVTSNRRVAMVGSSVLFELGRAAAAAALRGHGRFRSAQRAELLVVFFHTWSPVPGLSAGAAGTHAVGSPGNRGKPIPVVVARTTLT